MHSTEDFNYAPLKNSNTLEKRIDIRLWNAQSIRNKTLLFSGFAHGTWCRHLLPDLDMAPWGWCGSDWRTYSSRVSFISIPRTGGRQGGGPGVLFKAAFMLILRRQNQRFETLIQNADPKRLHGSTVHVSLEKKTISWACTAHCSRLLFELKWTGKAFIWRHLNVVICDFAFMLPPESAFCSNHDRKRTLLGVLNQRFETPFIRK